MLDTMKFECVIFDSDVLIEFDKLGILDQLLSKIKKRGVAAYYPSCYSDEAQSVKRLQSYYHKKLLHDFDIESSEATRKLYRRLGVLPFDKGERYCYAIADAQRMVVLSDDKLAAYSYLAARQTNLIRFGAVRSGQLIDQLQERSAPNSQAVPRVSTYKLLRSVMKWSPTKISENEIARRRIPRNKEWFFAKDIALEHRKLRSQFTTGESFYHSIGRIAASVYALPKKTDHRAFKQQKHWKHNVGLKIKSTHKGVTNIVFMRNVSTRWGSRRWQYNLVAYSAIVKYLKKREYLVALLNNSNNQFIGEMTNDQLNDCLAFTKKFRALYDRFRVFGGYDS